MAKQKVVVRSSPDPNTLIHTIVKRISTMGEELFNIRDDNVDEFNIYFEQLLTLVDAAREAQFVPPSAESLKVATRLVQTCDSTEKLNAAYRSF
jgi:hypothetical protein